MRLSLLLKSRAVAAALAVLALSYPAPAQIHDELSIGVTDGINALITTLEAHLKAAEMHTKVM